jgi:nucleoside-diphosphate-sugar epimerase
MAHLAAAKHDMRYCHTRILSTYGEGMGEKALIVYLIKTLLTGEKPMLTKCEQLWDFMYSQDTAQAMLAIAEKGVDGKTYPIGSGAAKPLREYVEIIRDIINPSIELGFGEKEYYPHQPMYLCADISELRNDTGFKPSVNFEDGIRKTIEWVKSGICGY